LAYLVRARYDDGAMELEDLEWRMLVRLAHRYGWQTEEDLDHYIHEPPEVLPESTSQTLAEALEKAVECLHLSRVAQPTKEIPRPRERSCIAPARTRNPTSGEVAG
jgi:hypothetical protein